MAETANGEEKRLMGAHANIVKHTRLEVACRVSGPAGTPVDLQIFVDTGAEVNLIRRGLLSEECFTAAEIPLNILAANQMPIGGGSRETTAVLNFSGRDVAEKTLMDIRIPTLMYEADITDDAIVSYGWLVEIAIDIYARKHGLMMTVGQQAIWVTGKQKKSG